MFSIKSLWETALPLFPFNKKRPTKLTSLLSIVSGFVLLVLGMSLLSTLSSLSSIRNLDIPKADKQAGFARVFSGGLSKITGSKIASVEAWNSSLELIHSINLFSSELEAGLNKFGAGELFSLSELAVNSSQISEKITYLSAQIEKSMLLQKLIKPEKQKQISEAARMSSEIAPIFSELSQGDHKILILFQNTDELRATGGFIGSYALVQLQDGVLGEIIVEDIYDADGQFTGFIEPPAGVREYLSANNGLRLPDANWQPDFSDSAQQILRFFTLADRGKIDAVIGVNLNLAKTLLEITGPINLPDNETILTQENVGSVLRTDRGEFFAGSRAKTQVLTQAMTGLKLSLANLPKTKKILLAELLLGHIKDRDVQIFFVDPSLQEHAKALNITGELPSVESQTTLFIYPVESNVGINKVNPYVTRKMVVAQAGKLTEIGITFSHLASDQPGYINYQRLITNPDTEVVSIIVDDEELQNFDEEIIQSFSGNKFKQVGFLVPVSPGEQQRVRIALQKNEPPQLLLIRKQPGLQAIPLTLISDDQSKELLVVNDQLIALSQAN
ncbi:MAG: hypothetical protein COU65_03745 [Candidatus Pacebacteria bacterium CG10_big_fil_rev_8_21_14_0_10_42_12]|nr:MAG: hypothetical protein COU65_03745 [Candidatus Pacebacteria bacterium CG10_big_fil_rev_8_21_14_0_10_42_12]